MTDLERKILESMVHLEAQVQALATANPKPNLVVLFQEIDELTRQLPRTTDATLLHYLHKRSYEKARLFLEGRDAENSVGNCRHV